VTPGSAPDRAAVRVSVAAATRLDGDPVVVVSGDPEGVEPRHRVQLGAVERRESDGVDVREVVVDGWRVVVEIEPEARASLRERARRARSEGVAGGPVDVRAIIPGRIAAVNVASGDAVTAGQQLLVLEAMKMQNELRAPREGTVDRVAVAVGENVEVGDLLLVIR
jgi:biotin carboxyl carrier protein